MLEGFLDLLLAFVFGAGADPGAATYYVRFRGAGGAAIDTEVWTNYAPAGVLRTGFSAPGAGPGGRRQVTNSAVVEIVAAAATTANVEVHFIDLATAAEGGVVIATADRSANPIIVQNGNPVRVPVGGIVAYFSPAAA